MSELLHGGLMPFRHAPLYQTTKGAVGKILIDAEEVERDSLVIRRVDQVTADLARLQTRPATLADVLGGGDHLRKLLVDSVPFAAAEEIEQAVARLEKSLGADGMVRDSRPEFIGSSLSIAMLREMTDNMVEMIRPYREMRKQLGRK